MKLLKKLTLLLCMLTVSVASFSQQDTSATKFKPGPFIMGHIADAYEWHIATFGETHVSIPLLCMVYSEHTGFHIFGAGKLHHGHEAYEGLQVSSSDKYKGKLVEIIDGKEYRPYDFSITKNVTSLFISVALLLLIFCSMARHYKTNTGKAPKGFWNLIEPLITFVRDDIALSSIGEKKAERYTPYLLTIFFFIFLNNLLGLLPFFPGGANLTGNIAVTCVLALLTFIITTFSGKREYFQDIFWPKGVPIWLKVPPIIPAVELMGVFIKPVVLMVRLFANITAGHIIGLSFISLIFIFGQTSLTAGYGTSVVSLLFSVFMSLLELLVAFIQAYVFTFLSAIYIGTAAHEEEHEVEKVS